MKIVNALLVLTAALLFLTAARSSGGVVEEGAVNISGGSYSGLLPGDSVQLSASSFPVFNNNYGENVILEVDFLRNTRGTVGTPNNARFEPYRFQGDYDWFTTAGTVRYLKPRLEKVIGYEMDLGSTWVEAGGKYYIKINAAANLTFNPVTFRVKPELGGNVNISPANPLPKTSGRPWEENSTFNLGFYATIIDASQESVIDVFGQNVLDAITARGFGGTAAVNPDSWFD
jgi:hypothetical protein